MHTALDCNSNTPNTRSEVTSTVARTGNEDEDAGEHVEEKRADKDEPKVVEMRYERLRVLWDLVRDGVEYKWEDYIGTLVISCSSSSRINSQGGQLFRPCFRMCS